MKMNFQEKILIARLKLKDRESFAKLYDIYIDKIYRFIYFKVSKKEDAEDLSSQVFLKIWQYALENKIKIGGSFQALLYKTARNLVIDHYRKDKGPCEFSIEEKKEKGWEIADNSIDSEKNINQSIEIKKIEERLKSLKSEYQEVIILHYINELSIKEIADILEKNKGAVRVTIHRALKALKEKEKI